MTNRARVHTELISIPSLRHIPVDLLALIASYSATEVLLVINGSVNAWHHNMARVYALCPSSDTILADTYHLTPATSSSATSDPIISLQQQRSGWRWYNVVDSPTAQCMTASDVIGDIVLCHGGLGRPPSGASNDMNRFCLRTWKWLSPSPSHTPHMGHAGHTINGLFHIVGGRTTDGELTNTHEIYNSVSNTWSWAPPCHIGRIGAASCVWRNLLIICSGLAADLVRTIECYDTDKRQWSIDRIPPLPMACYGAAAVVFDDSIVVFGGFMSTPSQHDPTKHVPTASAQRYSFTSNRWTIDDELKLPDAMGYMTIKCIASQWLILCGGQRTSSVDNASDQCWRMDITRRAGARQWNAIHSLPYKLFNMSGVQIHI